MQRRADHERRFRRCLSHLHPAANLEHRVDLRHEARGQQAGVLALVRRRAEEAQQHRQVERLQVGPQEQPARVCRAIRMSNWRLRTLALVTYVIEDSVAARACSLGRHGLGTAAN